MGARNFEAFPDYCRGWRNLGVRNLGSSRRRPPPDWGPVDHPVVTTGSDDHPVVTTGSDDPVVEVDVLPYSTHVPEELDGNSLAYKQYPEQHWWLEMQPWVPVAQHMARRRPPMVTSLLLLMPPFTVITSPRGAGRLLHRQTWHPLRLVANP